MTQEFGAEGEQQKEKRAGGNPALFFIFFFPFKPLVFHAAERLQSI